MGIALHLPGPLQKTPETGPLPPQKFPKLKETDLGHLDAAVGLDAPQQIGASPRSQTMALGGIPHKADGVAHGSMITHVRILSPPGISFHVRRRHPPEGRRPLLCRA